MVLKKAWGVNTTLCSWVLDFLTGRPQAVKMGNNISSYLTLNTGAPQGCVLSPLLYSIYTRDCTARHSSNAIIKFADDTTVIGLITDNNTRDYMDEVMALSTWCQGNNLELNVEKTKELILDFRKRAEHVPITINTAAVERVSSFRFLGVQISEDMKWSWPVDTLVKKSQ